MKKFLGLSCCLTILFSCAGESDNNNNPERISEEMIIGNYQAIKMGGTIKGHKVPKEDINEMWTFTEDSLFIYKPCFVERNAKKSGSNYKETWYDYSESNYYQGDTLVLEIEQTENGDTFEFWLVKSEVTDEQKDLDVKKFNFDCVIGAQYSRMGEPLVRDRSIVFKEDLSFVPLDTIDLREENSENFRFENEELFYKVGGIEHSFKILFIQERGDFRVIPSSQCECEDLYADYFLIME